MSFNYSVSLVDPTNSPFDSAVKTIVETAASQWSSYVSGFGSIDIQVNIVPTSAATGTLASTTSGVVRAGGDGPLAVFETPAASELRTGNDTNGSTPDIVINVDSFNLSSFWFQANRSPVPSDKYDSLLVFTHEIGHGLGIRSFRDINTGELNSVETTFDKNTVKSSDGSVYFVGANAQASYGGSPSITTLKEGSQYSHFGNSLAQPDGQDLMSGLGVATGTRKIISDLDLAVMKDIGISVVNDDINGTYRFFDTHTGDHFYTTSASEAQQIKATIPHYNYEGVSWATPDTGAGTKDVFRFFDTKTGNHFLTDSTGERDQLINTNSTYKYEGVAFQSYTDPNGTDHLTLERFFNTQTGQHHFAGSAAEAAGINQGVAGPGWIDEGKGFTVHMPVDGMLYA